MFLYVFYLQSNVFNIFGSKTPEKAFCGQKHALIIMISYTERVSVHKKSEVSCAWWNSTRVCRCPDCSRSKALLGANRKAYLMRGSEAGHWWSRRLAGGLLICITVKRERRASMRSLSCWNIIPHQYRWKHECSGRLPSCKLIRPELAKCQVTQFFGSGNGSPAATNVVVVLVLGVVAIRFSMH